MSHLNRIRIGCSGWNYRHWRGAFYPERLPVKRWFEHYAAHFDTVEINNSFYRLPRAEVFDAWREQAPPGFCAHDMPGLATERWATGPLAYVRFHGGEGKYWGRYSDEALLRWVDWMAEQARGGRTVWAYFNNDAEAHAVHDALTLKAMARQSGL